MSTDPVKAYWEYLPEIVDTMQEGLVMIRPDGRIVLVNRSIIYPIRSIRVADILKGNSLS